MASHVILDGDTINVIPPANTSIPAPTINLRGFQWSTVDAKLGPARHREDFRHETEERRPDEHPSPFAPEQERLVAATAVASLDAPSLVPLAAPVLPARPPPPPFPLGQFSGSYSGNGFNSIFRPRPTDDTTFPPTVTLNFGGLPNDNILQLNLTTEQLTFGDTIGDIPNRGLFTQSDITLQGFPYLQTIQDVTNPLTGRGDNPEATPIHFEPGMWLFVPPSSVNPVNKSTLVRMASIPHGTTINAQCVAPTKAASGSPTFDVLDTTPTFISNGNKQSFPSMKVANSQSPRIPQDLSAFNNARTITDLIIQNPNVVLQNAIQGQTITDFVTFEVSTGTPKAFVPGGGTANISFLQGAPNISTQAFDQPNALGAFMSSKFWIETVQYKVVVPPSSTQNPLLLKPTMPNNLAPTPTFLVTPKVSSTPQTITIPGIQIQYSQQVNLNFATLSWPHVSVATLVPQNPQPFRMT